MTKRYVIVQESSDESGQRGVDAVYAGSGSGWLHWEAGLAFKALTEWLNETRQFNDGTRVTVVKVSDLPDRPRELMNRAVEAEKARQGEAPRSAPVLAVVTDVDPPTSELWDSIKETVTPDEVWEAAKTIDDGGFQVEDLQRAVVKNRGMTP